jgi:hypothetical protein
MLDNVIVDTGFSDLTVCKIPFALFALFAKTASTGFYGK